MILDQLVGQVVEHAVEFRRLDYQSSIASRQARFLHDLRRREAAWARRDRRDEAERAHASRLDEAANSHRYRMAEIDAQHRNAIANEQLRFVHTIQLEEYRREVRHQEKAADRELANSPFRWTVAELRERAGDATSGGQRPLLLIAPFQHEEDDRGRVDLDRQRFRRVLVRCWNAQPWSADLACYDGALTRPLVYDDDDLRTIRQAFGDLPVVVIHGHLEDATWLNLRITTWKVLDSTDSAAISVSLPELTLPAPTGDPREDQQALKEFQSQVANLCALTAGAYGDWHHLLRHGRTPQLHLHLPPDVQARRSLAVNGAALVPLARDRRLAQDCVALLTQATLLAEAGLGEAAHRTLNSLRAAPPNWTLDEAADAGLLRRLRSALEIDAAPAELPAAETHANLEFIRTAPWRARASAPQPMTTTRVLRGHAGQTWAVAFSPDGCRLVAGSGEGGGARIWDTTTGQPVGQPLIGHTMKTWAVDFSRDGRLIATGSWDRTVRLWDPATGHPVGIPLSGHHQAVVSVAFSPDGRIVASGGDDRTVRLWATATGQPAGQPLTGHTSPVRTVTFSPAGHLLASGSSDRTVRLWDAATGRCVGEPLTGHTSGVETAAFSPSGHLLATGSWDKTVRLWDPTTGHAVGQPLPHRGAVRALAFSPDGHLLATGGDDGVRLWDPATGQARGQRLTGHSGVVWTVAFTINGQLATGGGDGTIRLWDT